MTREERTIYLIKEIYKKRTGGGALHIVLDDGNFEDCHIVWCLENSISEIKDDEEKKLFEECANNLPKMPISQRYRCNRKAFMEIKNGN